MVQIEALPKDKEGFYQQQVNGHTLPRLAFHKSSLLLECLIVDNMQVPCLFKLNTLNMTMEHRVL